MEHWVLDTCRLLIHIFVLGTKIAKPFLQAPTKSLWLVMVNCRLHYWLLYFPWTNVGSRNQKAWCKTIVTTLFYITNYNSFAPSLPEWVLCEAATVSDYPACLCFFLLVISTFILVATTYYINRYTLCWFFNTWKTTKCFSYALGLKGTYLRSSGLVTHTKEKKRKNLNFLINVLQHKNLSCGTFIYTHIIVLAICLKRTWNKPC